MEINYFSKNKLIKSGWRLCLFSQEGQSFLEIMNLINKYGAGGLEWKKGVGFTPKIVIK